jgi:hypothetical protein
VSFARQIGWHELKNGELLRQAEEAGYELLLTSDKNLRFQQNLSGRKIAIVVLGNQQWPDSQASSCSHCRRSQCRNARQLCGSRNPAQRLIFRGVQGGQPAKLSLPGR